MPLSTEEQFTVAQNMQRYGGSFVSHLGAALAYADIHNIRRIKNAFPEYWEEYLNWNKEV